MADESIWQVSEGEEEEVYDMKLRNQTFYQSEKALSEEETQMARFMTDTAPGHIRDKTDFALMHSMTKKERKSFQ